MPARIVPRVFALLAVAVLALAGLATRIVAEPRLAPSTPPAESGPLSYRPGEVVVRFRDAATADRRRIVLDRMGVVEGHPGPRVERVRLSNGTVEQALQRLRADPDVVWAEPNYIVQPLVVPNDPRFPDQWPLRNVGQVGGLPDADIRATQAWDLTTGSRDVVVGIIDTGMDDTHPDLAANVFTNPGEIPDNGVDDDANGYVDDVHGWDFVSHDNDPMDIHGHGTHVAGTIGATGNDSVGVSGVCWRVRLLPLKFIGFSGGTTADAAEAIRYATRMGARLTNNSWGGADASQAVSDAIEEARDAGVLFVAAAGNSGNDNAVMPIYPASFDLANIVSVAATDAQDRLAGFSNYGAATVDLGAPGVNVLSTVPGGGYAYSSGTSMAAPHVCGALGLMFARFPGLSAAEAKARLLAGVTPLASLAGRVRTGGRLDAFEPIAPPDSIAPARIPDLRVVRSAGEEVVLAWTSTGDDGSTGRAVRYELRRSTAPIDAANFSSATRVAAPTPLPAGSAEQATAIGLPFSTTLYFAVVARDERGNGSPLSNVVVATTLPPPDIGVSPSVLSVSLRSREVAERAVTVANSGASELRFRVVASMPPGPTLESPAAPALSVRSFPGTLRLPDAIPDAGDGRVESASPAVGAGAGDERFGEESLAARETYVAATAPPRATAITPALAAPAPALLTAGLRVLILVWGTTAERVRDRLAEAPGVSAVDVLDATIETPAPASLVPYDAVILVNNRPPPDPSALGDVLADYVDGGGGLVMTLASFVRGFQVGGRLQGGGYVPFTPALGPVGSATLGTYDADHPIMRGVLSVQGDQLAATELVPGATPVASWSNGEPFVATMGERVVGVNVYAGDPGFYAGDVPRVLAQAVQWTRRGRWLSGEPESGVVPPGGTATVTVRFDAGGVSAGSHDATLEIRSNDPSQPVTEVAAHLDVSGSPDLALSGETVRIALERSYTTEAAQTSFEFRPTVPPAGPIGFELVAEGDYGDPTETAMLVVEGTALVRIGQFGADCAAVAAIVPVDSAAFALWMQDGRIEAAVTNSPNVGLFCNTNRHLLTLRYPGPVDPLDFGEAFVGERRTLLLRVGNRGTADLTLGVPSADRAEFRATATERTVPPGGSRWIAVEFAPSTIGPVAGTLTIPSDDPDTPSRTVRLAGRAVAAPSMRVEPKSIAVTLPEAGDTSRVLRVSNDGGSPLHARIEVRPAPPPSSGVDAAAAGEPLAQASQSSKSSKFSGARSASPSPGSPPGVATATFQPLASSPTPITCVVEDPAHGAIYAQEEAGRRFFRYVASADRWDELPAAPIAARNNGGAALLRGRVYASYTSVTDSIGVYDIASGSWSTRAAPVSTTGGVTSDGLRYLYSVRGSALVRYDPETEETTYLPPAPFLFDTWCSLEWFEGRLYGHEGGGRRRFATYDIAGERWASLPSLPAGAVLGAAIDASSREYLASGPAGGSNLYRYSLDRGAWSVTSLSPFAAADGGMGWLPGPIPGVCVSQGETGSGFVRYVNLPEFLVPDATDIVVAPHAARDVGITLEAGSLPPANYTAALAVTSDDPSRPEVQVPVRMTVVGAPRLLLAGQAVTRTSVVEFEAASARTTHTFTLEPAPAGSATLRLEADGDFSPLGATATLSVEGMQLGTVSAPGAECERATGTFAVSRAEVVQIALDGRLEAQVQNTAQVDPTACALHRHRVILTYTASADELVFGDVALQTEATLPIEIANAGSTPLTVRSVASDPSEFVADSLSAELAPGDRRTIAVRWTPSRAGRVTGTLTVTSDDPDTPVRVVALSGTGVSPPVLRVAPIEVVASAPERGLAHATLTIANDGGSPLAFTIGTRYVSADTASGELRARASSPAPLTCMTSDPAAGVLYAQEFGGTRFFRYRAAEDRWEPLADAPVSAANAGGATLLDGRVYVYYADQPTYVAVYDVATGTWGQAEQPLGRAGCAIASDGVRSLYLARGLEVRRWDPATGETQILPPPPMPVETWGSLAWFEDALYAQRGNGTNEVARWDRATGIWRRLPALPGGAIVGATVDPVTREYVAYGNYSGRNVYRYSIDRDAWSVSHLAAFAVLNGGLAWLPAPVPGVYLAQGRLGPGVSVLVGRPPFVGASPDRGVVAPGAVASVELRLGGASLPAGEDRATLLVHADDPRRALAEVPVRLELRPRPILELEPPRVMVSSSQDVPDYGFTLHRLATPDPTSGPGLLEVTADGDYGDATEFATVTLEGITLGAAGGGGSDCATVSGRFTVSSGELALVLGDGIAEVVVSNSPAVELTCPTSAHTVSLSYPTTLDPLDFGLRFLGESGARVLRVANSGTLPLSLSASVAGAGAGAFTVSPDSAIVPPGGTLPLALTFAPPAAGPVSARLVIRSDDPLAPERSIALAGSGGQPPRLRFAPEALDLRLGPGVSVERSVTLGNVGGAELEWSARAAVPAPSGTPRPPAPGPLASERSLEEVLQQLDARHAEITSVIPGVYDFLEGVTGQGIANGGLDMYDGGNELSTNLAGPIPYSDGVIRVHPGFGPGGRYFTRKLPGLFVLAAELDAVTELDVGGNLGADGLGLVSGLQLYAGRGTGAYRGLCKRVWGARQPSVNHLIVVQDRFGLAQSFPHSTDDDAHQITGLAGVRRFYYLLYATYAGGLVGDAATDSVLNRLLDVVGAPPSWISLGVEGGRLPPGAQVALPLTVDASVLNLGEYRAELRLESNARADSSRAIPIRLRVVDTPVAEVNAATLVFPDTLVGRGVVRELVVSNLGAAPLAILGARIDAPDFRVTTLPAAIAPGDEARLPVTFVPTAAGERRATLTLSCNDPERPSLAVALLGRATLPPRAELRPESTHVTLNAGAIATRSLTLCQMGGGTLDYRVVPDSVAWLTVRGAASGALAPGACAEDTLVLDARGLASGTYVARVRVRTSDPEVPERVHGVTLEVRPFVVAQVRITPRALSPNAEGRTLQARLTLPAPLVARDVVVSSVRFNGVVPASLDRDDRGDRGGGDDRDGDDDHGGGDDDRGGDGDRGRGDDRRDGEGRRSGLDGKGALVLSFDRAACLRTLSQGDRVPVTVSGTLRDERAFVATDTVRVHGARGPDHGDDRAAADRMGEQAPASLAFAGGAPNPFSDATRVHYGLPRAGRVRLEVFDLTGRRRRMLVERVQPAGWHDAWWDGRDESGRPVAPGMFVVRLEAGGEVRAHRVVRMSPRH